jgi:hypothetical protein
MASSQPVLVIPERRVNTRTNISTEMISFSVNVSSVKRWDLFLRSLFAKYFASGILAAMEYEGIESLR